MESMATVLNVVDRIRPWPWRRIAIGSTVAFLAASAFSTLLGYFLMGQTTKRGTQTQESPEVDQFHWAPKPTLTKTAIDKIIERNIFNSEGTIGDIDPNAASGVRAVKTQLPIKVVGIIYGGTPFSGIAMIENTQKRTVNSFLVNDPVAPDALVVEILVDQVLIENQGRREYAPLEEPELRRSSRKGRKSTKPTDGSASLGGNGYATDAPPESYKEDGFERKGTAIEMTQEYKTRLLSVDFANVLQDAKASPNLVAGVLRGWRMDRIRKNSIYEKAGIQNGDVIEEINGVVLTDAGQSIKLLQSLRNESEIDMRVNRNGQRMNIIFKVR